MAECAVAENEPDEAPERQQVGEPVKSPAGHRCPEGRIGEPLPDGDGALRTDRAALCISPAAEVQFRSHAVAGGPDVGWAEQAAEEQVTVGCQALPQLTLIRLKCDGVGQFVHGTYGNADAHCIWRMALR